MKLSSVTQELLEDLAATAGAVDPALGEQVSRLVPVGQSVISVRLLELVTEIAAEISRALPAGRVEVRLPSADAPELVYLEAEAQTASPPPAGDDGEPARLTLRLPQGLKEQAERAADAAGASLNAWIVGRLSDAVGRRSRHAGKHLRGFGRA